MRLRLESRERLPSWKMLGAGRGYLGGGGWGRERLLGWRRLEGRGGQGYWGGGGWSRERLSSWRRL